MNFSLKLSSFSQLTLGDVFLLISSTKRSFSPADCINFGAISESILLLAPYYLHIINTSFLHGVFCPDKHAVVRPILKKPSLDPSAVKNYRPVTLLRFTSKLLESVILSQLSPYVNSTLDSFQSGFRPSHSTESVLISVLQCFFSHFARGNSVLLLLLDMSSAFDLVNHDILLSDLSALGISSSALSLLKSYLTDRSYSVDFNSSLSCMVSLQSGVPQGSIFGPQCLLN